MSRHSFGTLLLSAGISIESIAKMMGHTNISTTQTYAKVTDRKISEDMDRLIERRSKRQRGENDVVNTIKPEITIRTADQKEAGKPGIILLKRISRIQKSDCIESAAMAEGNKTTG